MTTNENKHSGAAGTAGQAGNPPAMDDPADASIAGSAGNIGNIGNVGTGGAGGSAEAISGTGGSAGAGSGQGSAEMGDSTGAGQGSAAADGGPGAMTPTSSSDQAAGTSVARTGILIPPVDVIEDANGITLLADLPGVSRDKLDLRLETNSLTINGAVSLDVPQGMESRYAEVKHLQYQRTFALSRELDGEQASAELTHGVLKIRIPKTAHAQPRRVQINVA
ncbi:Hsp20/alpha crystallin family protein [Massilia scottii]|uniref:Hsp20/alpha crystallin family protein n=1 Tax=Massilia scottii TaxID=3057166 RepID=UPI002796ABD4|nr:Hsp20/alpha crystallin family protein [Massilia sp. CCM 9029]MDQ1832719.1 Hsp20/alpha crystallin family protein [Massilia sp. CCM 9029]